MELIPILSLIILVATIATFILAVGAYILYKIRERKGRTGVAEQQSFIQAELVTPSRVVPEARTTRRTRTGEQLYTRGSREDARYITDPQLRPTFAAPRETRTNISRTSKYTAPVTSDTFEGEKYTSTLKFKRYTHPDRKETKLKKEESLKWR